MKAILHLTKNCNLRCKYCYAPSKVNESMSVDTAKKGIDLVVDIGKQSACVSYFGGEPLLNFDMIKELTAYAEEAGQKADKAMHFRLSTNGTLFNEKILAYCRDHKILFAVSLDGDREAHDAQRSMVGGVGSFDLVDSKLDMMLEYNPLSIFTSVITPLNAGRLYESICYMWGRGIRNMVHQVDYTWPDWDLENFAVLKAGYEKLAAWYLEKTREGERFYMSLFDEHLKSHTRQPVKLGKTCDFGARKFSVAPDGRIFPCVQFVSDRPDAQDYVIGDVEKGMNGRWRELIEANKQPRLQCEGCDLQGRCANYCGCLNWQTTGKLTEVSPLLCEHERMLVPITDEIGNQLWKEKNPTFLKKHYRFINEIFEEYGFD